MTIEPNILSLLDLITNTNSMDDVEKNKWINILPSLKEEEIERLYNILENERIKLFLSFVTKMIPFLSQSSSMFSRASRTFSDSESSLESENQR